MFSKFDEGLIRAFERTASGPDFRPGQKSPRQKSGPDAELWRAILSY